MSNNHQNLLKQFGLTPIDLEKVGQENGQQAQQPGILHGGRYWEASFHLMSFLHEYHLAEATKVIDVGCGRGLSSVFCAKHFKADVTAIDADPEVAPFLTALAEANHCKIHYETQSIEQLNSHFLSQFNVLIASDICFWDEMSDMFIELIDKAIQADISTIIISDPGRPPFIEAAEHCVEQFYGEIIESVLGPKPEDKAYILYIENA